MKGHIMYQRLYGLILMSSFIFLTGVPLTSNTMLSQSGESKHPCLVPNLVGRQSLAIMVDINFVSENMTIQETSTILSQQIDLTTPSQITGLKPQNTVYTSTIMSKGIPVFKTDYKTISYSNTTSPPLETMTVPKFLKTSISETATFIADILSTSAAVALPTKNTSTGTTTNSMKITKSPSSENTVTTKRAGAIFETFYPTTATNFLYTSGFTKNSIVPKTSEIGSPLAIMKTASLCSSIESTSKSTPSWHKHISTGIEALPISTASQEFLASTVAGTVPWSSVKQTSTHIGTASAFPPMSVLISKAAAVDTVFPRNQKASTLAMTDKKISFTVHSMTLPSKPIETTSELRTVETELTSTNFQDVSSPRMEDTISISMPKEEASSMALSFRTSSSLTRAQSVQTNIDTETTHTSLIPGITLAPAADESMLFPTVTGSEYTKNTSTDGENVFPFISTRSAFTSRASESGPTTISDEGAHLFTSEINWTSRPDQTLLTSIFHGNISNTEHSSTTADVNIPPEASIESEATTTADAIINTDTIIDRYTTALSNLTSLCLANFSIVSRTTSVNKLPEFKLTTLLLRTTPRSTVAGNELLSTSKETVFPPVDIISTFADTELDFSTESASETTQTEVKNTIAFGETTIPVPESTTTQRFNASVTRKETTSHYLKGRSTIAATTEVSPFATMQEATDESTQMVTASVIVSPFPDLEKSTSPLDNKTATTEVRGRWLSPKSVKTTPETSYNGSTEIFNSTHTYTAEWTSETPPKGNPTPYPTSGSTKAFPEPLVASTIRILETSFATIPTERTTMSLSTGMLPPQPTTTHSLATPVPIIHMYSLPVNASAVTSMMMSEETKVTMSEPSALARASSTSAFSDVSPLSSAILTTASVPPVDQTASTTSDIVTPIAISFLTETTVSSLSPTSPLATKAETTFLSTSADRVTSSTPTLACSKYLPDSISVVTSTHMISTMSIPVATQSTSRVEDASTHALSFPNTFNGSGDVVSLITATTENYVIDETRPSANKLTTSDGQISQFSTRLANILVPTLSVTHISTLTSDKAQIITSLGKTLGTMEVTEISPSNNPFISESQSSSSLEMTDTGFAETTKISSHQTHSPSEISLVTPPDGISASSPTSGHTQTIPTTWISSNTDVHISEMSTSLGKTAFPSKALTITTFLSPDKESVSALSIYTCRTEKMTVRTTSVTQPFSYHQNTSFVDAISSRTTRISNPKNINTTLSHLLSPRTQPEVTSVASPISESTQTSPESLSFSITGLSSANFTIISTDRVTTALSAPSVTTALLGKTSMATSIPIYQMSSLPVTAFTSKRVSDTPTILMTKYSKITHADCLKRHSIATSGGGSEIFSVSAHDSAFSPLTVSPDNSTTVGSFSTLSSSITPRTTITIQTSTLDVTPVTYAGSTSKSTMVSSAFTTSEMTEMSSQITPTSFSSPTETTYPSVKTIPTTIMAGVVTPFVGTTDSFLLSSENTEAMSSIPKTTFSPFLSTSPQSLQGDKATTLGILTGITNTSLSTVSSGRVTIFTNTYSRTAAPKSVISSIPSDSLPTPLNIQVSQYLTSFKSTPRPTQSIKATTFFSSKTKKMTSLSENTSSTELTKGATSVNTPVSYHPWTPSSATLLSFKTFLFSPHSTKAEFSTPKTYLPPTSHMVEFPVLGTRTTSSNTQPLLMTSWNIPIAKDSQFPIFTTTHVPTPKKMETETPYLVPGSLSTFTASKTGLVSGNVMAISSISTSGILPTLGMSESPSLSISSRTIPTTLVDIKQTFVSFYNIGMSFSVFDEEPAIPITSIVNELAENWLNSIFQDSEFALANLAIQIKSRETSKEEKTMDQTFREGQEMATISHALYSCVCQVIVKANSSLAPTELISRIKSKIHGNLMHGNFTQDQLTLLVKSEHVAVKKLEPGKCKAEETTSKYKGTYKWLLTNPTDTAQTRCIKNKAGNATRICSISMDTGKSQWEKPKFKQCQLLRDLPDKIVDLANITISDENADDVAKHILNLINESPSLDEEETRIIVSKLSDISQCDEISMKLTKIILQIIDAVLGKQNNSVSDLHEVSNEILRIINHAGHKMEFLGRTANLTVASLALAVLRVDHTFEGMIFSIRSYEEGTDPEIYLSEVPLGRVLASIYLPKSLKERIPLSNLQTILFNFFGQTSLFKINNVTNTLTTYVVSASISDISIQNLADPVVITLQHIEGNQNYDQVHCAFWDFVKNNGLGGWNSSGCKVKETNINYTICHCDHLTHFGVLMDLSRSAVDAVNEQILVLITYTGCGISSIFLGVAMVTYIAFHKLRKDHPSKILINLCAALLMLNLVFLFNSWSSSFQIEGLCITAAVALHYFLLVSLTWMGLEAVHMYFALVKVFNIYIPNYILKFCLVGWGIPAIMVAIILSVKKDLYGTLSTTSPFCWIKDNSLFYISVVAYFCLIFLINFSMFCTVLAQLNSIKSQSQKTRQKMILYDLKSTTSLTFLLGLTWGFAFFAWGPVRILFLYLFAIFNTLQGFLIFVFHCVMKESVREQWRTHLCCRRLQLDNFSDGSSRYELNVGYKQERLKKTFKHKLLTPSLKSTTSSSTFKSLGSSQGTPSEISFPSDNYDEDSYCCSPLSCDVVPNCVRRILPVEIKMNSIHKQRYLQ